MFCAKCGNKLKEGEKFCAICGTGINGRDAQRTLRDVLLNNKRYAGGIAAFISVLIVPCLFLGWFSLQISPGGLIPQDNFIMGFLPGEIKYLLNRDINVTITLYDIGNYARGLDGLSDIIETSFSRDAPKDVLSALRSSADALGSAGRVLIANIISVLALAVFLSLLTAKNKKAGLAGQAATLLSFVIPLVFAISAASINSRLASGSYPVIHISPSAWVYITMILGAAGFLLITICKSAINGE